MAETATSQIVSKREQKRQAKLAKELAEKSQPNGLESVDLAHGEVLPILEDSAAGAQEPPFEPTKSPYIEPVQKRIRNYLKKKQKIDQLTERANDPEEAKKLNKDQLETLARKDQVLAPLKELQNLAEQFTEIEVEHNNALKAEASKASKSNSASVESARAAGLEEGKKILSSLIAFLGYASVLRSSPSSDLDFNDANEKLLSVVYLGGENSIKAAVSLNASSEELIEDTEISFKKVQEAILKQAETEQADSSIDSPDVPEVSATAEEDKPYTGSNFVSLSDAAKQPSTLKPGGISFLNESEIEGTRQPASEAILLQSDVAAAPSQTLSGDAANQTAAVHVDWSASVGSSNWADEDPIDVPVIKSEVPALPLSDTNANTSEIQTPDLRPVEDFKTIEKKNNGRDGRGRGRGSGRGRGNGEGRGRGRGKDSARGDRQRTEAA